VLTSSLKSDLNPEASTSTGLAPIRVHLHCFGMVLSPMA
jgi:hypothetical protein